MRLLLLVALLAGCETTRTSITRPIVTLGYDRSPSIVIVARGDAEAVERWAASLRAEKAVTIAGELQSEKVEPLRYESELVCNRVRESFPDQRVDEIIVLDVEKSASPTHSCLRTVCDPREFLPKNDNPPNCRCIRHEYREFITSYKTMVSAIRASSCMVVATVELPAVTGHSNPHPPIAFSSEPEVAEIEESDRIDSLRAAMTALVRRSRRIGGSCFQRSMPPYVRSTSKPWRSSTRRADSPRAGRTGSSGLLVRCERRRT